MDDKGIASIERDQASWYNLPLETSKKNSCTLYTKTVMVPKSSQGVVIH